MNIQAQTFQSKVELLLPTIPCFPERKLGVIGQFVRWIHDTTEGGLVDKIYAYAIVFFISIALVLSIVGIPLLGLGFKEHILQNKEVEIRQFEEQFRQIALENSKQEFIRGRREPLVDSQIKNIKEPTRKKMFDDLIIAPSKDISNAELLRMASTTDDQYLSRYNLVIQSG